MTTNTSSGTDFDLDKLMLDRNLRSIFQREAEQWLDGTHPLITGAEFRLNDDGTYQFSTTRRLFGFWINARRASPQPVAVDEQERMSPTDQAKAQHVAWLDKEFAQHPSAAPSAQIADDHAGDELAKFLQTAHDWIEQTDAFGYAAASGILECGGVRWNIDESKAALRAFAERRATQPPTALLLDERTAFDKALVASFPDMPARKDGGAQNSKFIAFAMFQAGIAHARATQQATCHGGEQQGGPVAEVIEESVGGFSLTARAVRFLDSRARPGDKLYLAAPVPAARAAMSSDIANSGKEEK